MAFGVWHSLRVIYNSVVIFISSKLYCDHFVYLYICIFCQISISKKNKN